MDGSLSKAVLKKSVAKKAEWDFNVPDSKKDILKILSQTLEGTILEYDIKDGAFAAKLRVNATVLYVPESDGGPEIAAVESSETVTVKTEIPANLEWDFTNIGLDIKALQPVLINSRKVGVRCNSEINISLVKNVAVPDIDCGDYPIETKTREIDTYSTVISTVEKINVSLNTPLPAGKPPISEILKTDICVKNKELKPISNKAVFKGDLEAKIIYISSENTVETAEFTSQFTEIIDIGGLTDELEISYEACARKSGVSAVEGENGEFRGLSVNGFIDLKITAVKPEKQTVIVDAYSPVYSETCKKDFIEYEEVSSLITDSVQVKEVVYFDETNISEIIGINATPVVKKAEISGGQIEVGGNLETAVYFKTAGGINSSLKEIPFNYPQDGSLNKSYDTVSVNAELVNVSYNIVGSNCVEIRANFTLYTRMSKLNILEYIRDIKVESGKKHIINRAPIVAYFVKEGDSLFSIAKKYYTTVAKLKEINGIEDESMMPAGQYLIIE